MKEGEMLKVDVVAQDPTVFTSDNRIIFLRSDGDPDYGPPNLVVPDPKEPEVNYFHIFTRDEQKWVNWAKTIGQKLAEYFGVEGSNWALKDFPTDYYMVEQRKGPRRTYRTDPYLYGSTAHRFRSTNEFLPHAIWLLCDPNLDTRNCLCIYCSKGGRGPARGVSGGGFATTSSKRVPKPVNKYQTSQAQSYRTQKANYKIRAQISPRGKLLPGVPHAIISTNERNNELAAVETKVFGECEGFRVGEIAYCRLKTPIVSEEDPSLKIIAWPVLIEDSRMVVEVNPEAAADTNGSRPSTEPFSLQGRVKQKRVYDVVFMPTHEKARVGQEQMVPGLMFKMPSSLKKVKLGSREDHIWAQNHTAPELNLENGKQRPLFRQVLFVFLYAVESFHNLRLFYTATDRFSRSESGKEPVKHVVFAHPNGNGVAEPEAPWLAGNGPAAKAVDTVMSAESGIDNGGANRFLQATEQNNYMDLDSDERSTRRRAPFRASTTNTATAVPSVPVPALDNNTYWQGILLGLERIWVGDLARLRLSKEDVEIMMSSLAKGNDLFNAEDRVKPDLASPYLLRIKAIYRIAKAEVEKTDDKIRVAGDVFRVVPLEKASSPEANSNGIKVKQENGDKPSPSPKKTKRPTFEIPFRPFLDKAYEDQLPMSPLLPEGFGYQRVNQASVEVVCSVQQLAGRLWCSFAHPGDEKLAKIEAKKTYLGHEDSNDPVRIRLSLAAMLPGAVKAMEVHPNEGLFLNRERAIAQACKLALESRLNALDKAVNRSRQSSNLFAEDDENDEIEEDGVEEPSGRANKKAKVDQGETSTAPPLSLLQAQKQDSVSIATPSIRDSVASTTVSSQDANTKQRDASPPLPANWIKRASRSGQGVYFANLKTKETSWNRPTA
jgi:hypothetical protein